jgi:hypothetical protein
MFISSPLRRSRSFLSRAEINMSRLQSLQQVRDRRPLSFNVARSTESRTCLPGFGMKVNERAQYPLTPDPSRLWNRCYDFSDWRAQAITLREISMLAFIEIATNKPNWRSKVWDEKIVGRWKEECVGVEGKDFTEKMFDYVGIFLSGIYGDLY